MESQGRVGRSLPLHGKPLIQSHLLYMQQLCGVLKTDQAEQMRQTGRFRRNTADPLADERAGGSSRAGPVCGQSVPTET